MKGLNSHTISLFVSSCFLLLFSHARADQKYTVGCFVSGECVNSIVSGVAVANSVGECVNFCQSATSCEYFSFNPADNVCLVFDDCPELSNENCDSCVSGNRGCPNEICGFPGEIHLT